MQQSTEENNNKKYQVIKCPHCNKEVTHIDGTPFKCPYCDMPLNQMVSDSKKTKIWKILFIKNTFAIVSAILLALSIILFIQLNDSKNNIISLSNKIDRVTEDYNKLSVDYNSLDRTYSNLKSKHKSLQMDYQKIESEINNYKDQQATIDDLNSKLTELQSQYDSLEADRNNLQAKLDAKKAEQERVAREQEAQRIAQQQANAIGGTVYWVAGGEVYHSTPNCATLKRSSNIQSGTIAQSGKNRACKVCH